MASSAVKKYWTRLVADGCLICGSPACIAHAHGGSITPIMGVKAKGKKLDYMDWLVLSLCPFHHIDGPEGDALDRNVEAFEAKHGRQADMIDRLSERYNLPLWALARSKKMRP